MLCELNSMLHSPSRQLLMCLEVKQVSLYLNIFAKVTLYSQIRRAIQHLLFPKKDFSWIRHVIIAFCLLFIVNLLVIFVPNIKDIFGVIGKRGSFFYLCEIELQQRIQCQCCVGVFSWAERTEISATHFQEHVASSFFTSMIHVIVEFTHCINLNYGLFKRIYWKACLH